MITFLIRLVKRVIIKFKPFKPVKTRDMFMLCWFCRTEIHSLALLGYTLPTKYTRTLGSRLFLRLQLRIPFRSLGK